MSVGILESLITPPPLRQLRFDERKNAELPTNIKETNGMEQETRDNEWGE
jgi:hypothetical protein